jgi:hypothetical protein
MGMFVRRVVGRIEIVDGWMDANLVVLFAVFFRHLLSLVAEVLLHGRVDEQFLSDGMTSQLPDKLVAEPLLVVVVVRVVDDLVVVLFEFFVIMGDGLGNTGRTLRHDGVCSTVESWYG